MATNQNTSGNEQKTGSNFAFKLMVAVITIGVLGLILRTMGIL